MLKEFRVKGFKNFKDELIFKLDDVGKYGFNKSSEKNGIVKTALIYGENGSGKSNLGYAIFDIVTHLTDKNKNVEKYALYSNLDSAEGISVHFYYKFQFGKDILEYSYYKKDYELLVSEEITINGSVVVYYNHETRKNTILSLNGAETLSRNLDNLKISYAKYISRNAKLDAMNANNKVFTKFLKFVDNMLLFKSLKTNEYVGFKNGADYIQDAIVREGKLSEFQGFLAANGLVYNLESEKRDEKNVILCRFSTNRLADLSTIASTGTTALVLFFYWKMFLSKVSFLFIDEFDAFYHSDVSKRIVEMLRDEKVLQCLLTTHNTDIMTNDLLRPDCYFTLENGVISSFANSTDKELRFAHNLQKMYKGGAFNNSEALGK